MSEESAPRVVRLGVKDIVFPSSELSQIEDSSSYLSLDDGGESLRRVFSRDGFVYLRGALGRGNVLCAREAVIEHLSTKGGVFKEGAPGVLLDACGLGCLPMMEGRNGVTHDPRVAGVLEGEPLKGAVGKLLALPPESLRTFDYKWLRAMPRKVFTGVHCDSVYMSRGSPNLLTCWIPFEEAATLELGALALYKGSHRATGGLKKLRETYGAMDTESEPGFVGSGWLTDNPNDVTSLDSEKSQDQQRGWVSGDFSAGDVIIFGMHTLHMSTANLTDNVRISCDVRWQSAGEPIDERYTGSEGELREKQLARKAGGAWATGKGEGDEVTMQDLRKRWGL